MVDIFLGKGYLQRSGGEKQDMAKGAVGDRGMYSYSRHPNRIGVPPPLRPSLQSQPSHYLPASQHTPQWSIGHYARNLKSDPSSSTGNNRTRQGSRRGCSHTPHRPRPALLYSSIYRPTLYCPPHSASALESAILFFQHGFRRYWECLGTPPLKIYFPPHGVHRQW